MNVSTNNMMTRAAAFAVLLASLCLAVAGQPAFLKPLNLEKTQGEVRVVVLRAGQVVSSSKVTQLVVTYAVEIPEQGAFSDLSFSSSDEIALAVNGKAIEWHGGFSRGEMGFDELPRQGELLKPKGLPGKAMITQDVVFDGLKIEAKKLDVKLQFTWRGNKRTFDFKEVPLN